MTRSRFTSLFALAILLPTGLTSRLAADDCAPLQAALASFQTGEGRWAYRQLETQLDRKGRQKSQHCVQVDPSLPWEQREILLEVDGQPATAKQQQQHQADREKERRKWERSGHQEPTRLRDQLDLERATVLKQTAEAIVYAVPLSADLNDDVPIEKLAVTITVDQATQQLRQAELHLRGSFHKLGVAKIKGLDLSITFTPDPSGAHPATITALAGTAKASLLFIPVGGGVTVVRSDLRWVKPYDDRFEVELGTPTAVDF